MFFSRAITQIISWEMEMDARDKNNKFLPKIRNNDKFTVLFKINLNFVIFSGGTAGAG